MHGGDEHWVYDYSGGDDSADYGPLVVTDEPMVYVESPLVVSEISDGLIEGHVAIDKKSAPGSTGGRNPKRGSVRVASFNDLSRFIKQYFDTIKHE